MPEYINPNGHSVHLTGPDGKTIKVRSNQRVVLPEYFDRYRARGFISLVAEHKSGNVKARAKTPGVPKAKRVSVTRTTRDNQKAQSRARQTAINKARKIVRNRPPRERVRGNEGRKLVVGRRIAADAAKLLNKNLEEDCLPISNNIGIGILSYNRAKSLKRLINSIAKYTDLRRTTVFISDDGSTEPDMLTYLDSLATHPNFVVLRNKHNIGVAGNSNRLIRCLTRFKHGLLLNDDVEVLRNGWDEFYTEAARRTGMHHFSFLQPGIYGANDGELAAKGNLDLRVVHDKPHGAVLAFTREMLVTCGYFNEDFGQYGMEHVDWSLKPHEFELQEKGFFDVEGSQDYFKVHRDSSAVRDRAKLLTAARKLFANRSRQRLGPTAKSQVPEITYVIPCRNTGRQSSIQTVVNNVRAQRFPVIHIIMVEQDANTKLTLEPFKPVQYYLAQEKSNPLFNKCKAFNLGVSKVTTSAVILHDADMVVPGSYTDKIATVLQKYDSCHLGGTVIYTSADAANMINATNVVDNTTSCERVVGYFEGGSLACRVDAYWKIGAFNEDFWGYGCEDCEFYIRLSQNSNWFEDRKVDFLHLWHSRVAGWDKHHVENKKMNNQLNQTPMPTRIKNQYSQLKRLGYGDKL